LTDWVTEIASHSCHPLAWVVRTPAITARYLKRYPNFVDVGTSVIAKAYLPDRARLNFADMGWPCRACVTVAAEIPAASANRARVTPRMAISAWSFSTLRGMDPTRLSPLFTQILWCSPHGSDDVIEGALSVTTYVSAHCLGSRRSAMSRAHAGKLRRSRQSRCQVGYRLTNAMAFRSRGQVPDFPGCDRATLTKCAP
jgi:hypothetical protein